MTSQSTSLKARILHMLAAARRKVPPALLERRLAAYLGIKRRAIRQAVRELVTAGELAYTNEYGGSFVEISFNRPMRVSPRIVLKPAGLAFEPCQGDAVVALQPGAAFGSGRHASTRLALRGIDALLSGGCRLPAGVNAKILDIGTGSGVLALAAIALGLEGGLGIDTDPCAVFEARENVRLNRAEARMIVSDQPLATAVGPYAVIAANLRFPTLARLRPQIDRLLPAGGFAVLSGLRSSEAERLRADYAAGGFSSRWRAMEGGWAAVVLQKDTLRTKKERKLRAEASALAIQDGNG
jgi:ribosomal protein L11 methyltransferase